MKIFAHEDLNTFDFSTASIFARLAAISISSSPYHPSYTPQSSVFPNQKSRSCADPPLMVGTRWWEDAFLLLLKKAAKNLSCLRQRCSLLSKKANLSIK